MNKAKKKLNVKIKNPKKKALETLRQKTRVFAKRRLSFCGPSHPAEALHENRNACRRVLKGVKRCVKMLCVVCYVCSPPPPSPPSPTPSPIPRGSGFGRETKREGGEGGGDDKRDDR